jgi:hypothetical protein
MNQKKCLKSAICTYQSCSHFGKKGEGNKISFFIPSIKPVKVKEEEFAVPNVERHSLPPFGTAYYRLQKSRRPLLIK